MRLMNNYPCYFATNVSIDMKVVQCDETSGAKNVGVGDDMTLLLGCGKSKALLSWDHVNPGLCWAGMV